MWRPGSLDRSTSLFIGLIFLSLVLLTVDLRAAGGGVGATLREGAQSVFAPVHRVVAAVTRPVAEFFEGASDVFSVQGDNRRLRARVLELENQLAQVESLEHRTRELEALLGLEVPGSLDSITAEVLAVGVSEFDHLRTISKGRAHGVGVDMPVVDEGGLVGRVVSVTATTAQVRLISDPTMRVAVRVERTGETGWLTGRGGGPMVLEMLNTDAAVIEGDLLITADGRFPAGIPVARVSTAARSEVGFALRTDAAPTAALTRIDFVRVLVFTRDTSGVGGVDDDSRIPTVVPVEPGERTSGESDDEPETTTTTMDETTTTTDDTAP
jgi:rod shape-determining protein MreC